MPHPVLQSSTSGFYIFADDAEQYGEGMPGLTISVSLSKLGGPFLSVATAVIGLGGGLYWIAPLAAHRDTLGEIAWRFTATGAVIAPRIERVVAVNDQLAAWGANTVAPDNDGIAAGKAAAEAAALLLDALTELDEDQLRLTAKAIELADVDLQPLLDAIGEVGSGAGDHAIVVNASSSGFGVRGVKVSIQGTTRHVTTGEEGSGQLNVAPGNYTLLVTPPDNYAPVANVQVTVPESATEPITVPIALAAAAVIAEPDDPTLCNVTVDVITQHGRRPDDAIVWAVPADKLPFAVESLVVTEAVTYTTNASGRAVLPLLQGEAVKIAVKFGEVQKVIDFTVPSQPTAKATVQV